MTTPAQRKAEDPQRDHLSQTMDVGPDLNSTGVLYRVWAQGRERLAAVIERAGEPTRHLEMEPHPDCVGYFTGYDATGRAGDLYRYVIDGGEPLPDFVSHFQPYGVLGPSEIVDAAAYRWQATGWQRPPYAGQVIYELHLGTFTPEGTYRSAIDKLDYLVELGITTVEIMPVADFAGTRNWGYDGVMLFAPTRAYGRPDDFRAFIDACHGRGLAVILDIVYNHLGPEGNFSHAYSEWFFHQGKDNPWGQSFNFDGPHSGPVRALMLQNVRYWLEEFRIDGFRFDATHVIHDPSEVHLMAEVAELAHDQGAFVIAEDDRNLRSLLEGEEKGGWGFDGVWADDFHHTIRVSQTREQQHFFRMVQGSLEEIAETVRHGWLYRGQESPFHKAPRGQPCEDFPPERFVYQISNHDQVGNRLYGDRLHQCIAAEGYRALSLFLLLAPYTPLLFMGQEWAADTPFFYFTDMSPELGLKIVEGRRREFAETNMVHDPADLVSMVMPQDPDAFRRSKLAWDEITAPDHAPTLALYREGLRWRRHFFGRGNPARETWQVQVQTGSVDIHYQTREGPVTLRLDLLDNGKTRPPGEIIIDSNAASFCHTPVQPGPITTLQRR